MRSITYNAHSASALAQPAQIAGQAVADAGTGIRQAFETLTLWQRRHDQRRRMAALDPRLMVDAGLTAEAIEREVQKPFWRA